MTLKRKVAIVKGGTNGISWRIAEHFVREGAAVEPANYPPPSVRAAVSY